MREGGVRRPVGRALALAALCLLAPASAGALDTDADGVGDEADNCFALANPTQRDSDGDGFGNACDADFDQDGVVSWFDRLAVEHALGARAGEAAYDEGLDLDGDGLVGTHEHVEVARRAGSPPGPSGLTCAGEVPCHADLVRIDLAEPVLSRSARVVWRAASPALAFEVERRSDAGPWELAARVSGLQRAFVDKGATGRGLAPGDYEYRVRGGGSWSLPRRVEIREECAGQAPTNPLLSVVEIVDHEPDGDHDGEDVTAALAECSRRRGCVLRALPVTYEDVNQDLVGGDFSHGLVIEGYGSATVFRSRVYSAADHDPTRCAPETPAPCYVPGAVFSISLPGFERRLDGVRFRNFHVDGRKREQVDPGTNMNDWQHWAISAISATVATTDGGCIHNVTARELMTGGFGVLRANGWIIEQSTAIDIGCEDDLTPCDGLERTPEYLSVPGFQATGFGIVVGSLTDGTAVRDNRVVRATKYGIAAVAGASGFHFHDNVIEAGGGAGIQCNACDAGVIERNLVRSMHYPTGRNATWPAGYGGELAQGIQCTGLAREIRIVDNLVIQGDGSGLRLQCSGPDLLVQGNAIVGNCRKHGESLVVADGEGAVLRGNAVTDHEGGCRYSVFVKSARGARIEGGSIASGPATAAGLFVVGAAGTPTSGLLVRNLRITGADAGVGVYLTPSSSGTTLYDSTCLSGFPTPLVDQSPGGARRAADPAGACSP